MAKVDHETASLTLMELVKAFGVTEASVIDFLGLITEGRLYVEGGRAVFVLSRPQKLENGDVIEAVSLREPMASDYLDFSRGMSVTIKDGATEVNAVMMTRRTIRAVATLGDVKGGEGVVGRFPNRDVRVLGELCDALGFFE